MEEKVSTTVDQIRSLQHRLEFVRITEHTTVILISLYNNNCVISIVYTTETPIKDSVMELFQYTRAVVIMGRITINFSVTSLWFKKFASRKTSINSAKLCAWKKTSCDEQWHFCSCSKFLHWKYFKNSRLSSIKNRETLFTLLNKGKWDSEADRNTAAERNAFERKFNNFMGSWYFLKATIRISTDQLWLQLSFADCRHTSRDLGAPYCLITKTKFASTHNNRDSLYTIFYIRLFNFLIYTKNGS